MISRVVVATLWFAVVAGGATFAQTNVPEPLGYRMSDYRGPTPATLAGARVVTTAQAEALWKSGTATFVDVLPHAPKPDQSAARNTVDRKAADGYPGQYLVARHRLWNARPVYRGLFAQGTWKRHQRQSNKTAGDLLSFGLLDVVERRQARAGVGLYERRLVP